MIQIRAAQVEAPQRVGLPRRTILSIPELHIRTSEYVCIVGSNGAGKTRLLRLAGGLEKPVRGKVLHSDPAAPTLGVVFQDPGDALVGSSVERDLAFGLENRGVAPAAMRLLVQRALVAADLEAQATMPPHLLSDGEKQRLALASALILEPHLLLLDEPTVHLDPVARRRFLRELAAAHARTGATTLHVTHRSDEFVVADRILGLREGRIVFDGSPGELLSDPNADALGVVWSELHQFRRELARLGRTLPPPNAGSEGRWNSVAAVVNSLEETAGDAGAAEVSP